MQRWAGTVTLADPLTMHQARAIEMSNKTPPEIERLLADLADLKEKHGEDSEEVKAFNRKRVANIYYDDFQLPAILSCVEKWELKDFPETVTLDNFPASPRGDSHLLIAWLFGEVLKVFYGESIIPNE